MKKIIFLIILVSVAALAFAAAPTVTNVVATPGTGHVKITYDLTVSANTACVVKLMISDDGGANYITTPTAVSGDIGNAVSPGTGKEIIWRPAVDGMQAGINYKAKVIADDGFVYVPAGIFTMGNTLGGGYGEELPTHSVSLDSFYMGKYQVTQAEYTAIMGSNPATGYGVGDNYPVYRVSWYSAIKYCNLRSMAEGLMPVYSISGSTNPANWGAVPTSNNGIWNAAICNFNANGYRLPTEAEWEYAARGASNTLDYIYSGSDNVDDVAWYSGNNLPSGTKPVGSKAPNALGLYDMSGNLHEWCWDWYGAYSADAQINPTGPASGPSRVGRGGNFFVNAWSCRVAARSNFFPSVNGSGSGFRLCRAGL